MSLFAAMPRDAISLLRGVFGRQRVFAAPLISLLVFGAPPRSDSQQNLEELLNSARASFSQADYPRAISLLQRAIATDPHNADANSMLGIAYLRSGHPSDAVSPLRLAVAANPGDLTIHGSLGDAEMELKDFAAASQAFEAAVASSNGSEQSLVWWTDFALERYRDLEFALRESASGRAELMIVAAEDATLDPKTKLSLLTQAASLDPRTEGVWGELGVAQIVIGSRTEVESSLKQALTNEPRAISTLELQALLNAAHEHWPESAAQLIEIRQRSQIEFEKLLDSWPHPLTPELNVKAAIWDCVRSRSSNCPLAAQPSTPRDPLSTQELYAEGRWEALLALPPSSTEGPSNSFWRGVAFAKTGDCLRAIPALERGLEPGAAMAAARLTNCYRVEALSTADRLSSAGKLASLHKIRGNILLSIRLDPIRAETEYRIALGLKPDDSETLEKLAEAYFSEGKLNEAEQSAEEALKLEPHRTQLLRLLIRIAMSQRDYPAAFTLLAQLIHVQPQNAWAKIQEATAYSQTDRPADAAQDLVAALDAGYPDPKGSLHALLAAQYRKLGRTDEARRAADTAAKLAHAYLQQPQLAPDGQP